MMNLEELLAGHDAHTAAQEYVLGFVRHSVLYALRTRELPRTALKLNRTSSAKGGWSAVRVRLSAELKEQLVAAGAKALGPASLLEDPDEPNKGVVFERITASWLGVRWERKSNAPWWEAGDLLVDGKQVQVKLDNATLLTEQHLLHLRG